MNKKNIPSQYPFKACNFVPLSSNCDELFHNHHKVLTYVEYRAVSDVFQNIDPPTLLHPASASSPHTKGGGVITRREVRGGGSIFWKTPDIGLASYRIIPLRVSQKNLYLPKIRTRKEIAGIYCTEGKREDIRKNERGK
jgi:hypothetical protein